MSRNFSANRLDTLASYPHTFKTDLLLSQLLQGWALRSCLDDDISDTIDKLDLGAFSKRYGGRRRPCGGDAPGA